MVAGVLVMEGNMQPHPLRFYFLAKGSYGPVFTGQDTHGDQGQSVSSACFHFGLHFGAGSKAQSMPGTISAGMAYPFFHPLHPKVAGPWRGSSEQQLSEKVCVVGKRGKIKRRMKNDPKGEHW